MTRPEAAEARRERYRQHCRVEGRIPLFSQSWWLDAAAGSSDWDVSLVENSGSLVASMPYAIRRRWGLVHVSQPPLTQHLGPWLAEGARPSRAGRRLSREKDLLNSLLDQIPKYDRFVQNWHPDRTNWLPFYWRGFRQTTRYTYVLDDLKSTDTIWESLEGRARTEIRRAEASRVDVDFAGTAAELYGLCAQTFHRQGTRPPFGSQLLSRLLSAAEHEGQGQCMIARTPDGEAVAGLFLAWDRTTSYYIVGGAGQRGRDLGAMTLCLWSAIRLASEKVARFDFEGSMIESIERYFRSFGARQLPYHQITHSGSRWLRLALAVGEGLR